MEEVELIKMIPHVVRSSIKKVCDFVSFLPCSSGGPRAVRRAGCKRGALNAGQAWLETITVRFFGLLQGRVAVVSVVKHIRHYLVSEPGGDKSSF